MRRRRADGSSEMKNRCCDTSSVKTGRRTTTANVYIVLFQFMGIVFFHHGAGCSAMHTNTDGHWGTLYTIHPCMVYSHKAKPPKRYTMHGVPPDVSEPPLGESAYRDPSNALLDLRRCGGALQRHGLAVPVHELVELDGAVVVGVHHLQRIDAVLDAGTHTRSR